MSHEDPHLLPGGACVCKCPVCLDERGWCCCPECKCQGAREAS